MQASTSAARARTLAMDPEEWKARVDLAAAFRLAALQNWDELLFAHLSARVPGHPKQFLMHPAAILFEEVTASNLHKLDENCNHVGPSDELPHKFAFPFHKGIYDAFPQAQCVMHLHTKYVTAAAMQEQGIIPGNQYACGSGPSVTTTTKAWCRPTRKVTGWQRISATSRSCCNGGTVLSCGVTPSMRPICWPFW